MIRLPFTPCPKKGKKPKRAPKPLKRSQIKPSTKKPATRSRFIEYGKDPTKTYHRKLCDAEALARAQKGRLERLNAGTPQEDRISAFLSQHGIKHERERIWMNGDRAVYTDIYVPTLNLVIELDGAHHRDQHAYDHHRSIWLARKHGCKVCRFWNSEVDSGEAEQRIRKMLGLLQNTAEPILK